MFFSALTITFFPHLRLLSTPQGRYGAYQQRCVENLSYGYTRPTDIVVHLLIDDGNRSRDHRYNLLDPDMRVAGISIGSHSVFGCMCAIALSVGYNDGPASSTTSRQPSLAVRDTGGDGDGDGLRGGYGRALFPHANLANDQTQPQPVRHHHQQPPPNNDDSPASPQTPLLTRLAASVPLTQPTAADEDPHQSSISSALEPVADGVPGALKRELGAYRNV